MNERQQAGFKKKKKKKNNHSISSLCSVRRDPARGLGPYSPGLDGSPKICPRARAVVKMEGEGHRGNPCGSLCPHQVIREGKSSKWNY